MVFLICNKIRFTTYVYVCQLAVQHDAFLYAEHHVEPQDVTQFHVYFEVSVVNDSAVHVAHKSE